MKVIWEPQLQVQKMDGNAERAQKCMRARGFKAQLEREARRERFYDLVTYHICQLVLGVVIFGVMAVALYFGSI